MVRAWFTNRIHWQLIVTIRSSLKYIGEHTKYDMRTITIIDCGDYGWETYVEQSPCSCIEDVEAYYYRIGTILFCNYLLKAGDMHYENLIASGPTQWLSTPKM